MIRPPQRRTVAALTLSAAALVGIVLHEGYTDRAVIPVKGDVPTIGFGTTTDVSVASRPLLPGRGEQVSMCPYARQWTYP